MQKLSRFILKLFGWKLRGSVPNVDKMVICVAPHTSNWDFVIGKLFYTALGIKSSFLIKDYWTKNKIVGPWLKKQGAIGVNRDKKCSLTDQLAVAIKESEHFHLAITPEGTRQRNPNWKLGFYYIAVKANVPIMLVGFDFKLKEAIVLNLFYPTGNEQEDIKNIKSYYQGITAKHPEKFALE